MKNNLAAIILAAGKGERMKSALPKVLHPVCGRPMIGYVLDLMPVSRISHYCVVLGYKYDEVKKSIPAGVRTVIQRQQLGTADAVKRALPALPGGAETVIVLYADTPCLTAEAIRKLLDHHRDQKAAATILTAVVEKPAGYGRILRDQYNAVSGIVEEKDADDFQKQIKEINTGIICFQRDALAATIRAVKPNNAKKEYYLTDVISMLAGSGKLVEAVRIDDAVEALGVNSRVELEQANRIMRRRINRSWMEKGVTIIDSDTTFIGHGSTIGADTTIYPFTVIENDVTIGSQCSIGPFAHLRPGTRLSESVTVGNFIEISRSKLARKSRAKHFGFIGDCEIGGAVNIGAGTVTANYDGKNKNKTVIRESAFIGSDTVLVAPIKIGKGARTGAGSVVTRNNNVPDHGVVVGVPARPLKR